MRLSVIGCGYVGLVTGACLAEAGHDVICTDIDKQRIDHLQAGGVPIYEQHLDKILASARKAGRISYTADAGEAIRSGDAIFICVGTPPKENGDADLSAIDHVARQIATESRSAKLVIEKSTVPARTGLELHEVLKDLPPEPSAVTSTLAPDDSNGGKKGGGFLGNLWSKVTKKD